jgi:hypothetical protein
MGEVRLSVIVPTCGRSTLENTVESIVHQLEKGDQLIVVGSRPPEQFNDTDFLQKRPPGASWWFIPRDNKGCRPNNSTLSGPPNATHGPEGTQSGAIERDMGDAVATGTHLLHIDDDDIFTKDAFANIRLWAGENPNRVLIFRMAYGIAHQWISPHAIDLDGVPTLGVQEKVALAAFGGMQMVFPRVTPNPKWDGEGRMKNSCEDYFVTKRYLAALGTEAVWPGVTIGIVRPTAAQILAHTGLSTEPLYAPQPAWNGRQEPRRKIKDGHRPEVQAAIDRRRAMKNR